MTTYNNLRYSSVPFNINTAPSAPFQLALSDLQNFSVSSIAISPIININETKVSPFQVLGSQTPESALAPASTNPIASLDQLKDVFYIAYKDASGKEKRWTFALLPAIENTLKAGQSTAGVPEIKPGLLIRTGMNYKRFLIPGGPPVFQSLGIEETFYQLVGTFIGAESDDGNGQPEPQAVYNLQRRLNSYTKAMQFDAEVVQTAREVHLNVLAGAGRRGRPVIDSPILISVYGLVQNIRYFAVRDDRTYYALDFRVTRYPNTPMRQASTPASRPQGPRLNINEMDRPGTPFGPPVPPRRSNTDPMDRGPRPAVVVPEVMDIRPAPSTNYQVPASPPNGR